MDENIENLDEIRSKLIDVAIEFGPRLLVAIVIMVAGWFVARWLSRPADRLFERMHTDLALRHFLTRAVFALVLLLFAIMALQNLGVELLPLTAGLGILAAGLAIIFTRPFHIGEYISIIGEEGEVVDMGLFSTVLTHPDRSRVVIPNRKIVGEVLHNYGSIRQLDIKVGVSYEAPLDGAIAARHLGKALGSHRRLRAGGRRDQPGARRRAGRPWHRNRVTAARSADAWQRLIGGC